MKLVTAAALLGLGCLAAGAIGLDQSSPTAAEDGNSDVPRAEGPNKTKKQPDIDWDEFMRQSNIAPFSIPAGSTTEAVVQAKFVAWVKKRLLDPELERLKGDPEEAALRPLFESLAEFASANETPALDGPTITRIIDQIKGPTRRPGIDYLCARILDAVGRGDPALHGYDLTANAAPDSGLPSICRLYAAAKLLVHADHFHQGDRGALEKKFFDLFTENLADPPVDDEDLRRTVVTHLGDAIDHARWNRESQCVELYHKSTLPEWARLSMIGQTEMQWAYRLRGHDIIRANKKDRAAAGTQAKNAREALTRAWQLKPDLPYAAQQMIIAVGRENRANPEDLRQWLDRAVAAECDYELAFYNYFWTCRNGEKFELTDFLAIGRACVETDRFDTELPTMFNLALCEAAGSMEDWHPFFSNPAISKSLLETRQKRLAKAAGGPSENVQLSQLAFEGWLTGDDALAAQSIARALKNGGLARPCGALKFNADLLGIDAEIALRDGALRGGPHGKEYEQAGAELTAGNADAAIADFEKALPDEIPYARPLVEANLKLAKFARQYAGGDWTPLPAGDRLCWSVLDGNWDWRPGVKRIRLTGSEPFGQAYFRGALGADFELRGHLNVSRPSRRPGGVTFYCGHPPAGTGADAADPAGVQVFCTNEQEVSVQFMDEAKGTKYVRWANEMPFLYRHHAGKVSFTIRDKEVLHEQDLPENEPTGEGAVGVGVLGYGEGSFGEVWGLEARRLEVAPQ